MFGAFADNERVMGQISYIRHENVIVVRLYVWCDVVCWCLSLYSL